MKNFELERQNILCIGALGHIGLPLAIQLVKQGHKVNLYDTNKEAVRLLVEEKKASFFEPGLDDEIAKYHDELCNCYYEYCPPFPRDVIILATSSTHIEQILQDIHAYKHEYIILRQTLEVGTMKRLLDDGWNIAYCPERIAQGHVLEEIESVPQIISHSSDTSSLKGPNSASVVAELIFGEWCQTIRMGHQEAELAKLFCNFYRYGTFALVNQMWALAQKFNADFSQIREGIMEKYPRMQGFPKAGWSGGFCLEKDTKYLSEYAPLAFSIRATNAVMFPVTLATMINTYQYQKYSVALLGWSAMADVDDMRNSLRDVLRPYLLWEHELSVYDPYDEENGDKQHLDDALAADVIFIGINHSLFKGFDFQGKLVINSWE